MEQELSNSKLAGKIEEICEMLINGDSYRQIADHYGVGLGTVTRYLAQPEHSAYAREARRAAGQTAADKAREILTSREPKDMVELMWMREQASHYRWEASKKNPKDYGDKVEIEGNINTQRLNGSPATTALDSTVTHQLPQQSTPTPLPAHTGGSTTPNPTQEETGG
jgi:DNA-binding transcriptional MocR family regulator